MIGFFFIGAMFKGVKNGLKDQRLFGDKASFIRLKKSGKENNSFAKDSEENISKN
tara:strand:- start:148 stop:312 length:165 start_codon:yes stop_codon:yes gene_type:complete